MDLSLNVTQVRAALATELIADTLTNQVFTQVSYNSKKVIPGALFVCKGAKFNVAYLEEAIENGALAYISEVAYPVAAAWIQVKDIRVAIPKLANAFYTTPFAAFQLTGITGTKGKSTTTIFLQRILDTYLANTGKTSGIISSINTYDGIVNEESSLTTPEPLELFEHFHNARQSALPFVTMEVSSQGLKYHRVGGVLFDVGVFLNIDKDHISAIEHPDFEDYFQSKLMLFKQVKHLVINLDSAEIDRVLAAIPAHVTVTTISASNPAADFCATNISTDGYSIKFQVSGEEIDLGISGLFNVENALAAIAVARHYGIPFTAIKEALSEIRVPGRMELFIGENPNLVTIVDYAHNRLSYERLFQSCEESFPGFKKIIIFGCPGHKALNRRVDLAEVSDEYADHIILTMEDPNAEPVSEISADIAKNVKHTPVSIVDDRVESFAYALSLVEGKTVILFVGKGDETTHKIHGKAVPYPSDVEIVRGALNL
ncbi:UDP-N-acetylmuramoyl-L-alanyl-D-glutamate--2,6-diaminopimelate ligase [Gleimia coleocanis DSM 15436]|uniref:UDP-N-acetylmuramoyl-L-alanyl-D-glutamate--2, 6-diaminopimelate ligase n=1 Tax=Gleimia coleocanis DSM 15436 TaxID=525245 RepID=C0W096_9ACTO|nr:UDP-N-acetylmuramyl-tripeptide synthetase [Gleimia coleocanis]EEH63955.1 UDP-N-acetylmuramoyl-L-alanyl-D-glutamate--2,6-diaminopimelate ligase [Gleimia coleocanis DSM 15436]